MLLVAGVDTPGPYGLLVGLAPLGAVAFGLRGRRGLAATGPRAEWRELSSALGWLLAASLLAQAARERGPRWR